MNIEIQIVCRKIKCIYI